jgi:hypothetical protein
VTWQLRLYRVKDGELDDWVREWRELVLPLRRAQGFDVRGPWLAADGRFVWMIGRDDFEAANEAYYASPERTALDPDPARHLAGVETVLLEEL